MQWGTFNLSRLELKSDRQAVFKNISRNKVFVTESQVKSRSHSDWIVGTFDLINRTLMKPVRLAQSSRSAILDRLRIFECKNHRPHAKEDGDVGTY
jgi:hypothetical protein